MIVSAPRVSNPTPTPSIDASMRKQNGRDGLSFTLSVLTNAQLFSAANRRRSSVSADPMAHSPRPGGMNFMWKMRRYISCADVCARHGFQPSWCVSIHRFCMLYVPLTTRSTVWYHCSFSPLGSTREYVRWYTSSPSPLKPKGGRSSRNFSTKFVERRNLLRSSSSRNASVVSASPSSPSSTTVASAGGHGTITDIRRRPVNSSRGVGADTSALPILGAGGRRTPAASGASRAAPVVTAALLASRRGASWAPPPSTRPPHPRAAPSPRQGGELSRRGQHAAPGASAPEVLARRAAAVVRRRRRSVARSRAAKPPPRDAPPLFDTSARAAAPVDGSDLMNVLNDMTTREAPAGSRGQAAAARGTCGDRRAEPALAD
mmetsp:Transcript_25581/g.89144  ORF Transcript_25581/g.89144 Transcript_25581/m.89144 type:complete len:375 (+) Transcript_25581:2247-3371(+)